MVEVARSGVNVLIWFSINLGPDGLVMTGPANGVEYFDCVADVARQIRDQGLDVVHLVSIGGWNSPHPNTNFTGQQWWDYWLQWNQEASRPALGWPGFDGFDWDIEGHDR